MRKIMAGLAGCGKNSSQARKRASGHGFSHADKANEMSGL
jgi:hypothetical protein